MRYSTAFGIGKCIQYYFDGFTKNVGDLLFRQPAIVALQPVNQVGDGTAAAQLFYFSNQPIRIRFNLVFFFSRRKKGQWAYLHDEPELIFLPLCSMLFEVETVKCRNVGMEAQVSQYHKFFLNFFDIIRNLLHHLDGHRLT